MTNDKISTKFLTHQCVTKDFYYYDFNMEGLNALLNVKHQGTAKNTLHIKKKFLHLHM